MKKSKIMKKITDNLAEKVFDVPIDGLTRKYQIVPQFSSTLRRDIVFWEKLKPNSIEGKLLDLKYKIGNFYKSFF